MNRILIFGKKIKGSFLAILENLISVNPRIEPDVVKGNDLFCNGFFVIMNFHDAMYISNRFFKKWLF